MPAITLLTDFGLRDGYVAAMKGVILGIAPNVTVVNITHEVPPQDIASAAFILATTYPYFPSDTIHVAVVDPGVGTGRRAILLDTPCGRFLAPDNGILSHVLAGLSPARGAGSGIAVPQAPLPVGSRAYVVQNRSLFLPGVSQTFHGRDIFAPVAARLALGLPAHEVGPEAGEVAAFPVPVPDRLPNGGVLGTVLHVDAFGNLITNLRQEDLPAGPLRVRMGGRVIAGLSASYQEGGEILAIIGSSGRLEIAARNANAAKTLTQARGAEVVVEQV